MEDARVVRVECLWLRSSQWRLAAYIFLSIISVGILPAVALFYPTIQLKMCNSDCSPNDADIVIIKKYYFDRTVESFGTVHHTIIADSGEHIASAEVNCERYCASSADNYITYRVPDSPLGILKYLDANMTHPEDESQYRIEKEVIKSQYGKNDMQIPDLNIPSTVIKHALNPFLMIGYFSAIVWYVEDYYLYSTFVLVVCLLGVYALTEESRLNHQRLKELVGKTSFVRNFDRITSKSSVIDDRDLYPGDLFYVEESSPEASFSGSESSQSSQYMVIPCDAVLLQGRVVMDESMLTGESVPASKTSVELKALRASPSSQSPAGGAAVATVKAHSDSASVRPYLRGSPDFARSEVVPFDFLDDQVISVATKQPGSVLYAGTRVLYASESALAVCYRSGFRSTKGQLIASMIHPRPGFLQFFEDALWVIILMFVLATLMFVYEAVLLVQMDESSSDIVLYYFDCLTIAIPIALVACIVVSTMISIYRLRQKDVYVNESSRVNFSGIVSVVSFDKTGTLTEDSLQFQGSMYCGGDASKGKMSWEVCEEGGSASSIPAQTMKSQGGLPTLVRECFATCHNLSVRSQAVVGDPLEVELFRASKWTIEPPRTGDKSQLRVTSGSPQHLSVVIRKHFPFAPELMRSASMVERTGPSETDGSSIRDVVLHVKGSPETVAALCDPSTIPVDFVDRMNSLTRRGFRVIAIAKRDLSLEALNQAGALSLEDLESGASWGLESNSSKTSNNSIGKLTFLGLIYLTNRLKEESRSTVMALQDANIHVNMITGDHVSTAINTARECGILNPVDHVDRVLGLGARVAGGRSCVTLIIDQNKTTLQDLVIIDADRGEVVDIHLFDLIEHISTLQRPAARDGGYQSSTFYEDTLRDAREIELAVTGPGLQVMKKKYSSLVSNVIIRYAKVFARSKPADKMMIVKELKEKPAWRFLNCDSEWDMTKKDMSATSSPLGKDLLSKSRKVLTVLEDEHSLLQDFLAMIGFHSYGNSDEVDDVLFCGDGANDIMALRHATVGVSLCEVETSISAPITSKNASPGSVIALLLEGRSSLITTYVLVHFNINFGFIILVMTTICFYYELMVADSMYWIQGLFYTFLPGAAITITPCAETLGVELPSKRYFTLTLMAQLIPQMIIFAGFQIISLVILSNQSFYTRYTTDDPFQGSYSYEETTLENVVLGQLMIASVVSTIGEPFRMPWYTNKFHIGVLVILSGFLLYELFAGSSDFAEDTLVLEPLPTYFSFILLGLIVGNAALSGLVWWLTTSYCKLNIKSRVLPSFAVTTDAHIKGDVRFKQTEESGTAEERRGLLR